MLDRMSLLFRFQAIAEAGSVRKASEVLNVTQPALSRSIAQLETHYGEQIFHRHARGVRPTAFGERLLSTISRISRDWEIAEEHLTSGKSKIDASGKLSVSAGPLWSSVVLPVVVTEMQRLYPNITISIRPDVPNAFVELLEGRLDVVFGGMHNDEDQHPLIEARDFHTIRDRLVAREGHPIHECDPDDYAAVLKYPWIIYSNDPNYRDETLHSVTERTGSAPDMRVHSASLLTTLRLLQEGDYLAILPDHAVLRFPGRPIRLTPIVLGNRQARTGAIYRKVTAEYPPLRALMERCERFFKDFNVS